MRAGEREAGKVDFTRRREGAKKGGSRRDAEMSREDAAPAACILAIGIEMLRATRNIFVSLRLRAQNQAATRTRSAPASDTGPAESRSTEIMSPIAASAIR